MKVILSILALVPLILAEPPVPGRRYLPSSSSLPSTRYGIPAAQYGVPSTRYGPPNTGYESDSFSTPDISTTSVVSQNYGVPSLDNQVAIGSYEPTPIYGTPNFGNGYSSNGYARKSGYDGQSEPANYNFKYDVQEAGYGNDFGHEEERQNEDARGKYHVLLPDGRKQTVEYSADVEGFKPKISYEQTNNGFGRSNGGYTNGGYSNGGYSSGYSNGVYSNGGYSNRAYPNGGYSNGVNVNAFSSTRYSKDNFDGASVNGKSFGSTPLGGGHVAGTVFNGNGRDIASNVYANGKSSLNGNSGGFGGYQY